MTIYNKLITKEAITSFGLRSSEDVYTAELNNEVATLVVPEISGLGANYTSQKNVLAIVRVLPLDRVVAFAVNNAATVNLTNVFLQTSGEFCSGEFGRVVKVGDTLSFNDIVNTNTNICVSFYAVTE